MCGAYISLGYGLKDGLYRLDYEEGPYRILEHNP